MQIGDLQFLVIEDHDFQRNTLVLMLKALGARIVYDAADGYAALKIIEDAAAGIDIIISDLDMPGMDGMEFIRHLGEAKARVSIILASSLAGPLIASVANMTEAYGINLLGVVEKPLTRAKLLPLVTLHKRMTKEAELLTLPPSTLDEIKAGLKNDEFEPFFQPKIELATGQAKGAEALARWRHALQGIVPPRAFIKLLEENGLINELTWVMLRKAAAYCRAWRASGMDATVSVNLSVASFEDLSIADQVTRLVRGEKLEPRYMVLEVTESAATVDVGKVLENLARLRIKGFGLSIDDYGTGYSSMQQLARIAFTELKIDQSFVIKATKQRSARTILESSIEMAKKLNITSVAEGVETRADYDLLCDLHCDVAQGYFIARPMPGVAYPGWVSAWTNPNPRRDASAKLVTMRPRKAR